MPHTFSFRSWIDSTVFSRSTGWAFCGCVVGTLGGFGVLAGSTRAEAREVWLAPDELSDGGHELDTENYSLSLETPGATETRGAMEFEIHLMAKNGKKINLEYPTRLKVLNTDAWQMASEERLVAEQATKPMRATLLGSVKALRSGSHRLNIRVHFSVCSSDQCLVERVDVSDLIDVK